jgi:putative transcriptional regulator
VVALREVARYRAARSGVGLLLAWLLLAAAPAADEPAPARVLVAQPHLTDPNFAETLVLLVEHDDGGALGVVVNRPYGRLPAGKLLEQLGRPGETGPPVEVVYGGPVQPEALLIVHSGDRGHGSGRRVGPGIAVSGDIDLLGAFARGEGPTRLFVALGYAGWAPGQLDAELARGDWSLVAAEADLVFPTERTGLWDLVRDRRGVDL